MIGHLMKHSQYFYLPPALVREGNRLPDTIDENKLEILKKRSMQIGNEAVKKFSQTLLDYDFLKVGFQPVFVEIEGVVYKSPHSNFYRSFALFDKCFDFPHHLLENENPVAHSYLERLRKLGHSTGNRILPFFERKSPHPTTYETQTYIKGPLAEWPKDGIQNDRLF